MGIIKRYLDSLKLEEKRQIDKLLDDNVFNTYNIRSDDKINGFYTKDEADEIILKSYDKKSFLKELKRQIKPQVIDDMSKSLSGKSKDEQDEEKNEIKKKNIEKDIRNIDESEKIEKKLNKDNIGSEVKKEIIKAVYINTLKEYYKLIILLQESKNGTIKTGSIVNGNKYDNKYDNKLIAYQLYMRKLDLWYRVTSGGTPIGLDESVNKEIKSLEYRKTKNDTLTMQVREKQIKKMEELNNELEEIENKMVRISNLADNSFSVTEELVALKKEYANKKLELALLSPSVGIMHAENEEANRNNKILEREGVNLDKKYSARIYGSKINSAKNNQDYIKNKQNKTTEKIIHDDMISDNISKVENAIKEFDKAMDEQRYEDAIQSISVAGDILSLASNTLEMTNSEKQVFDDAKAEVERIKMQNVKEQRNNSMGIGAVYTEKEIFAKDIAERLYSKRDEYKHEVEKIKNSNEKCR